MPTPLGEAAIAHELDATPGWERAGRAIERTYRFNGFKEALFFVNGVAALAERANHHPDVTIRYKDVTVSCWTHAASGITALDFDLARRIDAVLTG